MANKSFICWFDIRPVIPTKAHLLKKDELFLMVFFTYFLLQAYQGAAPLYFDSQF